MITPDTLTAAACTDCDTNIWFENTPTYNPGLAKTICGDCPIRTQCLNWAIRMHIRDGIFGGLTPTQRDRYRRDGR